MYKRRTLSPRIPSPTSSAFTASQDSIRLSQALDLFQSPDPKLQVFTMQLYSLVTLALAATAAAVPALAPVSEVSEVSERAAADITKRADRGSYTVAGLGSRKQAILGAGGNTLDLAIAMLETEKMTTDYTYGKCPLPRPI